LAKYSSTINQHVFATAIIGVIAAQTVLAADKIPLTVGAFSTSDLAADALYQNMERALKEAPGKPFAVKMLVRGEAGPDELVFSSLRRGRLQMAGIGYVSLSTLIPEFNVLTAPFLFNSWDEADFVWDNFVEAFLNELLAENGIIGLRHTGMSWHNVWSKTAILTPSDAHDVRFRVTIDEASQLFARAMGADVIQVSANELVTGLQTGLLEAGDTNMMVYSMLGIWEEAPHVTLTRHSPGMVILVCNKSWWDRLTPDLQQIVRDADTPPIEVRQIMRADAEKRLAQIEQRGVIMHELTTEQRTQWRSMALSTHETLIDLLGGRAREMYNLVLEGKLAFALQSPVKQKKLD